MSRYAYINGKFLPFSQAQVSIEDRAYVFGDGIYEVIHFKGSCLVDGAKHFDRLLSSATEIRLRIPPLSVLREIIKKLFSLNRVHEGFLYIQISRGVAPRDQLFPSPTPRPSVLLFVKRMAFNPLHGISVVTAVDPRWKRCDIKSINLLPNVLARQNAFEHNAYETWFLNEQGHVTEGSLSNAWIVKNGSLYTAPSTANILNGITRQRVISLAKNLKIPVVEETFSLEEALQAQEAFITSTNSPIIPILKINNHPISQGKIGTIVPQLYAAYMKFVETECQNDC